MSASDDTAIATDATDAGEHATSASDEPLNNLDHEFFDVREFARTARGNHRAELDLEPVKGGLDPDVARLTRAMRDIERSTMQRMRNLLVTATHKDARATAFFTTWAFERFWIADALDAVLEASGSDTAVEDGPHRHDRSERVDRRGPIRRAIVSNIPGADIVGAHVTTSLVDEWVTSAAYRRLAAMGHAVGGVVDVILEVKERHLRFLAEEAKRRLQGAPRVQRFASKELVHQAWPIGAVERPDAERTFFEETVFGDAEGREQATSIGERVAALPGIGSKVGRVIAARLVP